MAFTNQDRERAARIEAKVDELVNKDVDKEKRIRSLEKTQFTIVGAFTIISAFLSSIVTWYSK